MRLSKLPKALAPLCAVAALALGGAARAEPAIWVVKGPHITVYLFGTVHLLKANADWETPKIKRAFDSSDHLIEEINNVDGAAAMQPVVMKLGMDAAHPLSTLLTPADDAKLDAAEADLGLPAKSLEPLRPWFAAVTLTVIPMMKSGYDPAAGVDRDLKAQADARKEPVEGFETAEQQLGYFASMPDAEQIAMLRQSLDEYKDALAKVDELAGAWAKGDVDTISTLVNDDIKKEDPRLYDLLLVKRNQSFAAQIAERMKGTGVIFVAVGAGHLAGPDSVQVQLAKLGYRAERF